jgi:hypothetical protein
MSKKPGLTLAQHDTIGLTLQAMRDDLVLLVCVLGAAYLRKPRTGTDLAGQAQVLIDRLRYELEEKVFRQHWTRDHDRLAVADREETSRRFFNLYHRVNREDYQPAEAMDAMWKDVLAARHGGHATGESI